jgi:hypothetical protein
MQRAPRPTDIDAYLAICVGKIASVAHPIRKFPWRFANSLIKYLLLSDYRLFWHVIVIC